MTAGTTASDNSSAGRRGGRTRAPVWAGKRGPLLLSPASAAEGRRLTQVSGEKTPKRSIAATQAACGPRLSDECIPFGRDRGRERIAPVRQRGEACGEP